MTVFTVRHLVSLQSVLIRWEDSEDQPNFWMILCITNTCIRPVAPTASVTICEEIAGYRVPNMRLCVNHQGYTFAAVNLQTQKYDFQDLQDDRNNLPKVFYFRIFLKKLSRRLLDYLGGGYRRFLGQPQTFCQFKWFESNKEPEWIKCVHSENIARKGNQSSVWLYTPHSNPDN